MDDETKKQLKDYLDANVTSTDTSYTYTGASDPLTTGTVWIDNTGNLPDPYTLTYPNTGSGTGYPYTGITTTGTDAWQFTNPSDETLTKVLDRLEAIEKRLSVIDKAPDDKIKALEEAYAHYKFIEKLCEGEENDIETESE